MDWDSKATKKHIKEAKAVGLSLIGEGKNNRYRTFRFSSCGHEQEIHLFVVKKSKPTCQTCIQNKQQKEARDAGLVLLKSGKNANYRTYRFNKCGHKQELTLQNVRNVSFRCNTCHENEIEDKYKTLGIRLLRQAKKKNFKIFQFIECGHIQEIHKSSIREKHFKCSSCQEIKHKKESLTVGLILLGKGKSKAYRIYRFKECGHEQEIQLTHVRRESFRCSECLERKIQEEAKSAGLIVLGSGSKVQSRRYRFRDCGHEKEYLFSNIKRIKPVCDFCQEIRFKEEAKAAGLTLLGKGKKKDFRKYRFKKCGHLQEMQLIHVRRVDFICNSCEETSRDLPSKVYILQIQSGRETWLKVGYAKQVSTRIEQYRLPKKTKVKKLKILDFETGREAHEFESTIHSKYIHKRLSPKKMNKFHKHGYNECYPMKMLDTLMEELS